MAVEAASLFISLGVFFLFVCLAMSFLYLRRFVYLISFNLRISFSDQSMSPNKDFSIPCL